MASQEALIIKNTSGTPVEVIANALKVDGSAVIQPISGTVTVDTSLLATALKQDSLLAELQLKADLNETQPVSLVSVPLPTGASTATKQDEQTALLNTLNSLLETNNALVQMMSQLIGAMNAGAPALRIIPIASVSTAVTGSVTATVASTVVSSLTNFGTGIPAKEMANDMNNIAVQLSNINNITF